MTLPLKYLAAIVTLLLCLSAFVAPLEASQARHCSTCGLTIYGEGQFCPSCGAALPPLPATPPTKVAPLPEPSAIPATLSDSTILAHLSDVELRRLIELLLERRNVEAQPALDSNSVAMMTRLEMEQMIRKIQKEQPKSKEPSGFNTFLQYIGGGLLILLFVAMLGTL